MSESAKYVIIGNSAAAIGGVEGIRSLDKTGSIIIISAENWAAYSRPLISYLLEGRTDEKHMLYRDKNFYKTNTVSFMPGKTVTALDTKNKTVRLDNGETVGYEKLLNATGSRPFVPPMGGLDSISYFTFLSLDSAKELGKAISKKSRVLIIGAGLIGMKCAEGIADRVAGVTIVEMAPRCLPTVLEEKGSEIIQKKMEEHNISFVLGDSVKQFTANSAAGPYGGTAETVNGRKIEFDVLVCAVGVRPNTQLVEKAGGKVAKGIVIDDACRTTLPDVYAAGDCTLSHDMSAGTDRILAILPNAYLQGECAGINMAGGQKPYTKAIPINSAGFFGLHMVTAGSYSGTCIDASRPARKASEDSPAQAAEYRKFFVENDLLKGFIIIGDVNRSGIYTALIRDQTPLSTIDFDAIKDEPRLMAFSKSRREKILAAKDDVPSTSWNFATV